jgi:hypothetical protein
MKWEKAVKRVMQQKTPTAEDALNQEIWRKATENQERVQHWKTVIDRQTDGQT